MELEVLEAVQRVERRLDRFEKLLDMLVKEKVKKDFYTTADFAKLVDRDSYTVREWCRLGRVNADKYPTGHGTSLDWRISHVELERYEREGLLPRKR